MNVPGSLRVSATATMLAAAAIGVLSAAWFGRSSGAAPLAQADTGWTIDRFDVTLSVQPDGAVRVTEDIAVDFDGLVRHGIFRRIPVRYPVTDPALVPDGLEPDEVRRVLELTDLTASSDTAPDDVHIDQRPSRLAPHATELVFRIGDPDITITGAHRYRISYTVRGAVEEHEGRPELFWNATGTWPVPIRAATVTVIAPSITEARCLYGAVGARGDCGAQRTISGQFSSRPTALDPGEQVSVAVAFAPGTVAVPPPIIEELWSLRRAWAGSPWAVPLALLTLVGGWSLVGLLVWREGRDRVAVAGTTVDGRDRGEERPRPLFGAPAIEVRFRPPEGLRPGQLGVLVDERVDPVDIAATAVDLAVRGLLRISGDERRVLWFTRTDWVLEKLRDPEPGELLDFEQRLFDGLFDGRDRVTTSELRGTFVADYRRVRDALYRDAVRRRWFPRRPDRVRALWLGIGIAALVGSSAAWVALLLFTHVGMVGAALDAVAVTLVAAHRWMPRRTARGSRLLRETLGFREFIRTAEADRMRFAAAEELFVPYLPYAVVFGAVDRWTRAFAELGVDSATATPTIVYVGGPDAFAASLSDLTSTLGSAVSVSPSSGGGGSGFGGGGAGGGFGGGGGGSW